MSSDSPPMSSYATSSIEIQGLGKTYHLYANPRDRLKQMLWQRLHPGRRQYYREFHALRDINLDIASGEVLGVVGRNGAGKSTLLQLVSQTLTPSTGFIRIHGRIAALLELGAGFSPDFSGRENIFMNAAILGLSRSEIEERYDSIVAFSGIGPFIDQPVKTYSSGMYVRLAFAVASSIEPDILIIDEALSVGDGEFARKSFDRIMELKSKGVTILFCSHSLYQVEAFCSRVLWLDEGRCRMLGEPAQVVGAYSQYLASLAAPAQKTTNGVMAAAKHAKPVSSAPFAQARFDHVNIALDGVSGRSMRGVCGQSELRITVGFSSDPLLPPPVVGVVIDYGSVVAAASVVSRSDHIVLNRDAHGRGGAEIVFPSLALRKGEYRVSVYLACESALHFYDQVTTAAVLHLEDPNPEPGLVVLPHQWRIFVPHPPDKTTTVHGRKFTVDQNDSLGLFASNGIFEPLETELCRRVVKPGMRVLDVGANIGYYTTLLSELVGDSGHVVAVEPDPENYRLLQANCAEEVSSGNVILHQVALGRAQTKADLYRAPDSNGMHRLYSSVCCGLDSTSVTVLRGDDLTLAPLHFMKIDVEGFEPAALEGLEQTMALSPELSILCEFSPLSLWEAGFNPLDFINTMRDRGFFVYAALQNMWRHVPVSELSSALHRLAEQDVRQLLADLAKLSGRADKIEQTAQAFLNGCNYPRPLVESIFFSRRRGLSDYLNT